MESLKSIARYPSVYDLVRQETIMPAEENYQNFLRHCDDYEPREYYVINGDTIVVSDSISGDVFTVQDIGEFLLSLRQAYLEEANR